MNLYAFEQFYPLPLTRRQTALRVGQEVYDVLLSSPVTVRRARVEQVEDAEDGRRVTFRLLGTS